MQSVFFEGAEEIKRPDNLTDEQCSSVWAFQGVDVGGYEFWVEAWKPSYEDIQAINRGEPIFMKILSKGLPPVLLFTIDENGESNDTGLSATT